MSDVEQFTAMLTRAGITFTSEDKPGGTRITIGLPHDDSESHGVDGYDGFYTEFLFNEDGSLAIVGVWE